MSYGEGLDQPTPDDQPWWKAILFCVFIAPVIIAAVTVFAGVVLALVAYLLQS